MLCVIYPFHTMRLRSVTETMKVSNSAQSKNQFLEKKNTEILERNNELRKLI